MAGGWGIGLRLDIRDCMVGFAVLVVGLVRWLVWLVGYKDFESFTHASFSGWPIREEVGSR